MRLWQYIKDNVFVISISMLIMTIIVSFMLIFKTPLELIIIVLFFYFGSWIIALIYGYFRKKFFYDQLAQNLRLLDEKYLIHELIKEPSFLDGKILCQVIYDIAKSMKEKINDYEYKLEDFKEYIELWIHEVKLPLQSLTLMAHNRHQIDSSVMEQIDRIDNYVEQVLYYARSENSENDYMIKEFSLEDLIRKIALKNKDAFLLNNITLNVDVSDIKVLSDSKWLEFIINQIISNSLKYHRTDVDSYVAIKASVANDKVVLAIRDNGIGISKSDLGKVFNKSFTGANGRIGVSSTGMGLYIAKKLCNKMGHVITIDSELGEFTEVKIIFEKNDFFAVLK